MKIVQQVFLFLHFLSATNKIWHLKLVQRESQLGHVLAMYLFKYRVMEAGWEVEVQLHEFLTATQDMVSVLLHTPVASPLKKGPSESTEQQAEIWYGVVINIHTH